MKPSVARSILPSDSFRSLIVGSLALIALIGSPALWAGESGMAAGKSASELFPWATFDPEIPTQEQVTGVVPGSRALRHGELLRYLEALAEASPRARLQTYAKSHEGRSLVVLAISDEETIRDLETFRVEHARRMDPRGRRPEDDASGLESAKAVAWMAYGIHGDELSSSDAAASLAYWLVAGEDGQARALRDGLLVLIDPIENPDGRDRFLSQTASFAHKVPNPDQEDLSHTTVWPWGRGNHYLFDLNRDWFTMVHPESRRSELIASWHPQLVLDCHEMGSNSTYLFSPPRDPDNPFLPSYERKWWNLFSADQAKALDKRGYGYYTGEWNEEFFPGYGSTWPTFHGAIGILYEMSGTEGTLVRKRDGSVRTYAEAVEHQVTSSVANLETLAANRKALLADYVAVRRQVVAHPQGPARAWVLPRTRYPKRADDLAELLRRQGIEVYRSTAVVELAGLRDARTGERREMELAKGSWMVPLDQPAAPLASVLLDPHVAMDPSYLREERESIERGDGSRLYDATAWSLPLLYGVDVYWTSERPKGPWSLEEGPEDSVASVESLPEAYAYLLDGASDQAMGALAELLQTGITVRAAEKPFRVADVSYDRGTLLVRREGNPDDLVDRLTRIASKWSVSFTATATADSEEGPDLGGSHFATLREPRVGILTGMPVSPSDYGSLWYVLDVRAGLRFNGLELGSLSFMDLDRYNVLVFPPNFRGAEGYKGILGEAGVAELKAWIEGGGTAIGIGNGAGFLADKAVEITSTRLRSQALEEFPPLVLGAEAAAVEAAAPMHATGLRTSEAKSAPASLSLDLQPIIGAGARPFVAGYEATSLESTALADWLLPVLPSGQDKAELEDLSAADRRLRSFGPRGALLRVDLAPRHWMSWGIGEQMSVFMRASDTLVAEAGVDVVARFPEPDRLHLGGLLWPEAAGRLGHTAFATREQKGEGQVILFLDHPTYRGWPLESQRMFLNALLYGPGLGTEWSAPW